MVMVTVMVCWYFPQGSRPGRGGAVAARRCTPFSTFPVRHYDAANPLPLPLTRIPHPPALPTPEGTHDRDQQQQVIPNTWHWTPVALHGVRPASAPLAPISFQFW